MSEAPLKGWLMHPTLVYWINGNRDSEIFIFNKLFWRETWTLQFEILTLRAYFVMNITQEYHPHQITHTVYL